MSHKRAWTLVGTLSAMFREPLVTRARGGPGVGGASLTDTGRGLALYRAAAAEAAAAAGRMASLQRPMRDAGE